MRWLIRFIDDVLTFCFGPQKEDAKSEREFFERARKRKDAAPSGRARSGKGSRR